MFGCARCGTELTGAVSRVALPVHLADTWWEWLHPPLLEPGTYAVDPDPSGPPWRLWQDIGEQEAAERGYFLPGSSLSYGPAGTILLAPGDTRGTELIPDRLGGYCWGIDGRDGPNLACVGCGREVGTRVDDCGHWQVVRLLPEAVVPLPAPPERPVLEWAELLACGGLWRGLGEFQDIPAGVALAHLVAASGGAPMAPAPGVVAETFGRALAVLGLRGDDGIRVDLAGPGRGQPEAGLLLVPLHPQTGEVWQPRGGGVAVPVEAGLWAELAFPSHRTRLPAVGGLPAGVERDDPLPPHPALPFEPSWAAYRNTLERMPAVREPWLRALARR